MRNLYEILGITKTVTEQEIKKIYKKLAIKHHPDRGGDQEKFKEIAAAYEVLIDKDKRQIYDQFGEEGLKQHMQQGGGPDMDPFGMFFNMDQFFHGQQQHHHQQQQRKCDPVVIQIEVTLEQLYNGDKIIKDVPINKLCRKCNGSGIRGDHRSTKCDVCNGHGIKTIDDKWDEI